MEKNMNPRVVKMIIRISQDTYQACKRKMLHNRATTDGEMFVRPQVEAWVGDHLDKTLGKEKESYVKEPQYVVNQREAQRKTHENREPGRVTSAAREKRDEPAGHKKLYGATDERVLCALKSISEED